MQQALAESFDIFGRYSHLWSIRRACMPPERLRILDVGDPFGFAGLVLPDDDTVSVDFSADPRGVLPQHDQLIASGTHLPFPDGSFDLVATHDTLEHVPGELRGAFIDELARVSRGPVVMIAPFADPRTSRCEQIANAFFVARFGHSMWQLDEHRVNGLPRLDEVTALVEARDLPWQAFGDGWLYTWLTLWLVKTSLISEGDLDTNRRLDMAYNELLRDVDHRPPHYRRTIVIRPPEGIGDAGLPALEPPPSDADVDDDLMRLMELAADLTMHLERGQSVASDGSGVREWIRTATAGSGPVADAAHALETALDRMREQQATAAAVPAAVDDGEVEPAVPKTSVSIVVVNLNGAEHLPPLLESLAALDYPDDLLEVIVVDNGSVDRSLEILAAHPDVKVLPQPGNLGFSPAVNIGVAAATGECVLLLNNDMRVDPDFVTHLVAAYDPEDRYVCVAATIVSWDGDKVDFAGGTVNFYGMGDQTGFGTPIQAVEHRDGDDLLFACGGAMLVSRAVWNEVGGLDDEFFAYFEDVDFGWRLWLYGYRVRLTTKARAYHRLHGTASRFAWHQRLFLYERNALRSIIKNYDDSNMARVLASALLLVASRAVARTSLPLDAYRIGGDPRETEEAPRAALAHLHAMNDVASSLDELLAKRARIQAARVVPDSEVLRLFGNPFRSVDPDLSYMRTQELVVGAFGLDQVIPDEAAHRLLVVTAEPVGVKMGDQAVRACELARALAGDAYVSLAVPAPADMTIPGIDVVPYQSDGELESIVESADVVLIQGHLLRRLPALAHIEGLLVADLYDPWLFENMELRSGQGGGDVPLRRDVTVLNDLLDTADFFVCASDRQRDYWLGMLAARGRIDMATYEADRTLRKLIDVVPFGLPSRPPRSTQPVLKGVHPAVAEDDLVVLSGGGTGDWFDPLTTVSAFRAVVDRVPNAKLYFMGLRPEDGDVAPMEMARRAVAAAEQLGLAEKHVIFGEWVPFEEREAYLVEADLAVSAARDLAESRLAFRSRVLDYLWAGLPVVTTEGDFLSDIVREHELGVVVAPENAAQLADAMIKLLKSSALRAECAARARDVAQSWKWHECVEPLRGLLRDPAVFREIRRLRGRGRVPLRTQDVLRATTQELHARERATGDVERLLAVQTQRAELHLGEVLDLLQQRETDRGRMQDEEAALAAAREEIESLRRLIAEQEAFIDRVRNNRAFKVAARVRNRIWRRADGEA